MNTNKLIRILENHGIIFNVRNGRVYVTDIITENATLWTEKKLYEWLGY